MKRFAMAFCTILLTFMALCHVPSAHAQPEGEYLDQAKRVFSRLNGVPPTTAELEALATYFEAGRYVEGGMRFLTKTFYDVTLVNVFTPFTNEEGDKRRTLNDMVATAVGLARDGEDFRKFMYEDVLYVFEGEEVPASVPKYSRLNANNYLEATKAGLSLGNPQHLVKVSQSGEAYIGLPSDATSGWMTTRQGSNAYLEDGTNRALLAYTYQYFLCTDIEEMHDLTIADHSVGPDVTRSPGGDANVYNTECKGCHAGMDAQRSASCFYDFDGNNGLVYDISKVNSKCYGTVTFQSGHWVKDAAWKNLWTTNKRMGWRGPMEGTGLKSWGKMLAKSYAFSRCMATHALRSTCLDDDPSKVALLTEEFDKEPNLSKLFVKAALQCRHQ